MKEITKILLIPSIGALLGVLLILYGLFLIPSSLQEKRYSISISAEPLNENISRIIFGNSNFYYDFSSKKGYFKFSSNQELSVLNIDFPSKLVRDSLKTYNIVHCIDNFHLFCNKTEFLLETKIKDTSYEKRGPHPMDGPKITSRASIIFNSFNTSKNYLIEFKLKNFYPEGIIYFHRTNQPPLVINSNTNGNLMLELGNEYSCKNCFYGERNFEQEFWSSNEILRLNIPEENILSSSFRISTIPSKNLEWRTILLSLGISISISMVAIIVTFLIERKVLKKRD